MQSVDVPPSHRAPLPGAVYIGEGRNRIVFKYRSVAIKVPLNEAGLTDNDWEAMMSQRYPRRTALEDKDRIRFARCRLLRNGWLVMELLRPLETDPPDWAGSVDCGQVGLAADGTVVAYDFGLT